MGANFRDRWTHCAGIAAVVFLVGSSEIAVAAGQRLAWTQQGGGTDLRYKIFVDARAEALGGVSCVDGPGAAECSAPLPDMAPGFHTVALSAVDDFGNESAQSDVLNVTVGSELPSSPPPPQSPHRPPAASASSPDRLDSSRPEAIPSRACAGQNCFNVSLMARGDGAITRLEALGDGDLLMLRDGGDVLLLRGGMVSVAYQLRQDDPSSSAIADIAIDPDFAKNHLVYLAVLTTSEDASRVRLVRLRETGDRLAQAATIVPDVPVGHGVTPRLTISLDRHVYLAIPVATDGSPRQPYDGSILAFTEDGRSLGSGVGSPVLTRGPEQPATLERGAAAQVWIGAADAAAGGLQLFRLSGDGALAAARAVDAPDAGVVAIAFDRPDHGVLIAAPSLALYEFQLSPDGMAFVARRIDLGGLEATALTIPTPGEVVVAARDAANPQSVALLSLRSSSRAATR